MDGLLRIGELSERTGVSTRSLRYYEQQGLLAPERHNNGYRAYPTSTVQVVENIRLLLTAGLSTGTVRGLLPCMVDGERFLTCPALIAALDRELAVADRRLAAFAGARALLSGLRDRAAMDRSTG